MSAQASGLMRCNEGERLATGEFIAFAITCSGTDFIDTVRKGAPIVQVPPADFPAMGYFYLGVPKNAPHPNAGKLYALFCMTKEGQALVRQTWDTDLDLFPETGTHKIVADLEAPARPEIPAHRYRLVRRASRGLRGVEGDREDLHREEVDADADTPSPHPNPPPSRGRALVFIPSPLEGEGEDGRVSVRSLASRVAPIRGPRSCWRRGGGERRHRGDAATVLWLGFRVGDLGDPAAH